MNLIRVTDPDDPRVAAYRDVRERDLVGRQGLFVAEGKVVLAALLGAPAFEPQSMLILENKLPGLRQDLRDIPDRLPVYVAEAGVMDAIAGFPIHRGILAIGRRNAEPSAAALLDAMPARALVVAAIGISNHDNIGAIFRNAAAFGADAVFLDPTCCDPLYRKSLRVSVGGVFRTPYTRFTDTDAFVEMLNSRGFGCVALSPSGRDQIGTFDRPDRAALFLGTEGEGLPKKLLDRMDTVRIAMAPGFDSLNVGTASAIALHRLADFGASA